MLTGCTKAYSSSCSQTVSLSPAIFTGVPLFDALVRRLPWT